VIQPAPGLSNNDLMPVRITEGGADADRITLVSSSSVRPGVPTQIRQSMTSPAADLKVTNTTGYHVGDVIIVSDGNNCSVMQITQIQAPGGGSGLFGFVHNNGQGAPPYNMAGNITSSCPAYGVGANVYQLGQRISRHYTIQASNNTQALFVEERIIPPSNAIPSNAIPLVGDIVDLQAQYGLAAAGTQQVTCWVNASNAGNICDSGDWQNPTAAQVQLIRAVRLAVLARSPIAEKPSVAGGPCDTTTVAPTWSGGNFNLPANWQCHRFRVFETVVPLRNVIWGNA
ncbi:MAG: PilW family protein, partial [Chloroflexus sp.]